MFQSHLPPVTFQTATPATRRWMKAIAPTYLVKIPKINPIASTVSMTQAVYIQNAGGLNFAATKNPSASGTKNFA